MEYSSDRDALLDYYKHLLVNNEISVCKKRKLSDSDSNGLISAETRNGESCKWECFVPCIPYFVILHYML
jgi:hypothetical protein